MPSQNPLGGDGKVALIGLPFDINSSYARGCSEAPPAIRSALFSPASNLWSENGTDLGSVSYLVDAGDLELAQESDINSRIIESIRELLRRNLHPIALGGDHAVTYPVIKAISERYPGLTLLDFDAHPDLYEEFEGNRFSHACPFARIMEERLASRLVQVGIRSMNGHQRRQAEKFGVEVIRMKDWRDDLPALNSPVFISFDVDALDPAFAPGVVHREPGGLSVRQVLQVIQKLDAELVGADIVEFNPRMDPMNTTAGVCAKLVKEIAAAMLKNTGKKQSKVR